MSSKFMKSAAVLGTATLASLLLVAWEAKLLIKQLMLAHLKQRNHFLR